MKYRCCRQRRLSRFLRPQRSESYSRVNQQNFRGIKAQKRRSANAWAVRQLRKKQRDMLALLGLKLPPKTFC